MRPVLLLLGAALTAGSWTAAAQADVPAAARAEAAYRGGDFAAAEAAFREALGQPEAPAGPLLYDLGNCAYRQGRLAEALWCYRRAQLRLPRDEELSFNVQLVEQELGAQQPTPTLAAALLAPLEHFTMRELLALAAALQVSGLLGALLLRRRQRLVALGIAALGLLLGLRVAHATWLAAPQAVVLPPRVGLRTDPSTDAPASLHVQAGDGVTVLDTRGTWARVAHAAGRGWIDRNAIGVVD